MSDVGQPKAEVAAARVMARVEGVRVTPHYGRIEDKPDDFYRDFPIIILGLDSLEARRYMNTVVCNFLGAPAPGVSTRPARRGRLGRLTRPPWPQSSTRMAP